MKKAADVEAFRAAVREIFDTWSAAVNAGDVDLWITLWDENGVQMPPDNPPVVGKKAIYESNRPKFDIPKEKFTINIDETVVGGNWGFARGTYSFVMAPEAGAQKLLFEGKYLTIFKRQPDGSWKAFRDCFNYNAPPSKE